MLSLVKEQCDKFLGRYDLLSTATGAMCVTTYCVVKGQDPGTAATVTVASVILALVLNELLFTEQESQQ
jgi:transposase